MDLSMFAPPPDASVHGYRVDWLLNSTSVFVLIMFLATLVWILWSSLFHGRKHQADYDLGSARKQTLKALGLSLLIFGVVDGNLFINGLRDIDQAFWNFDAAEAHPQAVRIEVNAHQWAWDVRYAGPDGKFNTQDDIVTTNDLRVPIGVPVLLQLAASDVLHSFSLPNFRVKQDAVPGMINRLWFQAKQTGEFEIACAQHCGVAHYKMKGLLTVLSPEAYAAWAAEAGGQLRRAASTPPTRPPTGAGTGSDEIDSNERRPATGRGRGRQPAAHPPAAHVVRAALRVLHRPQGDRQAVPVGGAAVPAVRGPAGDAHPLAVGLPRPAGAAGGRAAVPARPAGWSRRRPTTPCSPCTAWS